MAIYIEIAAVKISLQQLYLNTFKIKTLSKASIFLCFPNCYVFFFRIDGSIFKLYMENQKSYFIMLGCKF